MGYGRTRNVVSVTIPNGTALSSEAQTGAMRLVGIIMPAAWTAAGLTFQAVVDENTGEPKVPVWGEVQDSAGGDVTVAAPGAGEYMALADTFPAIALGRIRVRSGTSGVPVNQAADRTLKLVLTD